MDKSERGLFDLTGRVALVTGGSRGIGYSIARDMARAGAEVTMVDLAETVSASAATLVGEGLNVHALTADVTNEDDIARVLADVDRRHQRLDILVNNAAILLPASVAETDRDTWRRVIDTNLTACFFMAQGAARLMQRDGRGGAIINMSSIVGKVARRKLSAYIAAKAGIDGLTRSLASEFARKGITVNAIAPGFISTDMSRIGGSIDDFVTSAVPAGRWGMPEDISGVAVFLASKAASYVNGQTIYVDGGFTACSR